MPVKGAHWAGRREVRDIAGGRGHWIGVGTFYASKNFIMNKFVN